MIKIKCTNCEYEWQTNSKMIFVTCPCCMKKVKVRKTDIQIKNEQ